MSTSAQPNSLSYFDKVFDDYKNDLANLLIENFGVDVRRKLAHTKSPILLHLIRLHILLVLGWLSLLNSVGRI